MRAASSSPLWGRVPSLWPIGAAVAALGRWGRCASAGAWCRERCLASDPAARCARACRQKGQEGGEGDQGEGEGA